MSWRVVCLGVASGAVFATAASAEPAYCAQMDGLVDQAVQGNDCSRARSIAVGMKECTSRAAERTKKVDGCGVVSTTPKAPANTEKEPTTATSGSTPRSDRPRGDSDHQPMNGTDVSSIYRDAPSCRHIIVLDAQKRQPAEDLGCAHDIHAMCAGKTMMYPGSFNRVWWWLAGDQSAALDEPRSWLEGQICLETQMSQGDADVRALEIAKASAATAQFELLANCLDGCALSSDARKAIEKLEGGRGYEARYGKQIGAATAQLAPAVSVHDVNAILFRAAESGGS